ncbi:hypothetical protein CHUAL_013226 [Chamberlinius hualienensis]
MQIVGSKSNDVTNSVTVSNSLSTANKTAEMADVKAESNETKKDGVIANATQQQLQHPQQHGGLQKIQGNKLSVINIKAPFNKQGGFGGRGGGVNKRGGFGRRDRMEPFGRSSGGVGVGGNNGGNRGPGEARGPGNHIGNQFGNVFSLSGPTTNLPTKDANAEPKKFTSKNRLFVGNLTSDISEDEFCKMFEAFGEYSEPFLNAQKGFGFIKMDTRENADNARAQLDGTLRKGRVIHVRLAVKMAAVRVMNLSPFVTNELLEMAFSNFGEVERAIVIADERGKSIGEGIVEFARKPGANKAIERCTKGNFLLTGLPKPVIIKPLDQKDEEEGVPEKSIAKSNDYLKERSVGPHFAQFNTFENEICNKWKQLFEMEEQERAALDKKIALNRKRLEEEVEVAIYEHETNMLREKLRQREQGASNLIREHELRRREGERIHDDHRHDEMMRRPPHDEFMGRNRDVRRQQEDNLLMQANQLSNLLDQQEAAFRQIQSVGGGPGRGGAQPAPALGAGGPPGPVNPMDGGNMGGPGVGPGPLPNNAGMPMPIQHDYDYNACNT